MGFSGVFSGAFRAPLGSSGSAAAVPWYRAGGAPAPVAAYQPKGAASYAASKVNLANPGTNDATEGVAPSWSAATGWTFNGSTQWLDTGYTPANVQTRTVICQFSNVTVAGFGALAAVMDATQSFYFGVVPWRSDTNKIGYGNTVNKSGAAAATSGNVAVAGAYGYANGGVDSSAITFTSFAPPTTMHIGRLSNGTNHYYLSGKIQALAIYNVTLTAPQVAAVSAAMAAL